MRKVVKKMSAWFYIFISYVVLQGLVSLLGLVLGDVNREEPKTFFLIRIVKFILFIVVSPLWILLSLATFGRAIFWITEYKRLTGIDLPNSDRY